MIQAVIFDMDGVIVDSTRADFLAWGKIFQEQGKTLAFEEYRSFLGMRGVEIVKKYFPSLGDKKALELTYKKEEVFFVEGVKASGLKPIPGVGGLLEKLRQAKYPLALATSGTKKKVAVVLNALGFEKYFRRVVAAEDVSRGKPSPDIFLAAAKKLGVRPKTCLVIEDAPNGVKAAKTAGMKCVAITTTNQKENLRGADVIIGSYSDLSLKRISEL